MLQSRHFGNAWLILSAKYGLVPPGFRIPGPHDVTFGQPNSGPILTGVARAQAEAMALSRFGSILLLGGKQ